MIDEDQFVAIMLRCNETMLFSPNIDQVIEQMGIPSQLFDQIVEKRMESILRSIQTRIFNPMDMRVEVGMTIFLGLWLGRNLP